EQGDGLSRDRLVGADHAFGRKIDAEAGTEVLHHAAGVKRLRVELPQPDVVAAEDLVELLEAVAVPGGAAGEVEMFQDAALAGAGETGDIARKRPNVGDDLDVGQPAASQPGQEF